jgi:hypothetical protein
MIMKIDQLIEAIENQWDTDGVLGKIRTGEFNSEAGKELINLLEQINIDDDSLVHKRLLTILWYLPTFLIWQRERIDEKSKNVSEYDHFVTGVHNTLENVLCVP